MSMPQTRDGTLVATTVTTVTFSDILETAAVEVLDEQDVWVRTDGTNPTVGGDDCILVSGPGAVDGIPFPDRRHAITGVFRTNSVVKLISSGTPRYVVTGS